MAKNLLQYMSYMGRSGAYLSKSEALILFDRAERRYFSGVDIAEGVIIVCSQPAYFTDDRYFYASKEKLSGCNFIPLRYSGIDSVKDYLKQKGIKKVYTNLNKITVAEYNSYKKIGVKLLDGTSAICSSLAVKNEEEINCIKKACEITQTAFYKTLDSVKEGVTELDIKKVLEENMFALGAEGVAFDTIIAFGKNSAVPHHETGETKLKNGNAVLMDFGAKYNGFCADMTRTVFFGTPSEKFLNAYASVLKANESVQLDLRSGDKCAYAHQRAVSVLKEKNLDKYFTHSLGHGLGLEIHESPRLSTKSEEELKENTVFTIEPGVYFDGEFGIRIEDTVLIKDGIKRLFTDSKELIVIK